MQESDRSLVNDMLEGKQRAFDLFFDLYAVRLGAFVSRRSNLDHDSLADVVQISLIKAIRNLQGFRGESTLFTWLCGICRNELSNCHRAASHHSNHDNYDSLTTTQDTPFELHAPLDQEPAALLEASQRQGEIRKVLNRLPQRFSLALEYKYGDGLSVEQIGQNMGLTTIAAQSILARARVAFRNEWNEYLQRSAEDLFVVHCEGPI